MLIPAPMQAISSRRNPIVARFRDAAHARSREAGLMLLDGPHLVADARAAGIVIEIVAFAARTIARDDGVAALARALTDEGVAVVHATDDVIAAISPVRTPAGVVAIGRRPRHDLASVLRNDGGLRLIAVGVQDPGNLGAIVRAAEAAGVPGLVAAGASADPFGWKALRGSMGSALRLPIATAPADEAVDLARASGLRILATAAHGGRSLFAVDLNGPVAALIGGEGGGLPSEILARADEMVSIPMRAPVESLNAAVAAALIAYEAFRQRGTS
jgi:TrmH family RNA methyltransferase